MWFRWKLLGVLFVICTVIMWCAPAESLALRRSALQALESNVLELAYPRRDERRTGDGGPTLAAPPVRPAAVRAAAKSETKRTPAALLRKRVTPYQSRVIAAKQGFLCAICGKPFSETDLWDIGHKIPLHLCHGTRE